MCDNGNYFFGFVLHDSLGSFDKCTAGIGHIVDEDGGFVFYITDEDHARDFVGACALFVNQSEAEIEAVCY